MKAFTSRQMILNPQLRITEQRIYLALTLYSHYHNLVTPGIFESPYVPARIPKQDGLLLALDTSGNLIWQTEWADTPIISRSEAEPELSKGRVQTRWNTLSDLQINSKGNPVVAINKIATVFDPVEFCEGMGCDLIGQNSEIESLSSKLVEVNADSGKASSIGSNDGLLRSIAISGNQTVRVGDNDLYVGRGNPIMADVAIQPLPSAIQLEAYRRR